MTVHETAGDAYQTLIEPEPLRARLEDPTWIVIDCRFDLARPDAGREAFERGHIPNARYADLERDLSGPVTSSTGRHPLPDPQELKARLTGWGVNRSTQVVAYDEANGAFAARLWWLLRWIGHQKVAVLNGGMRAWQSAGYPVQSGAATASAAEQARPAGTQQSPEASRAADGDAGWLTTEQVETGLASGRILLIDARNADRFAGQNETLDPVAGHVPGARNHPFATNLDPQMRFLPPMQLREHWHRTLGGRSPADVVCMCGSGVTACHNLLALEVAGLQGARLYAGSWSEWIRDPRRPVAG